MSDWIECNLPWSTVPFEAPPIPDTSDFERSLVGVSRAELQAMPDPFQDLELLGSALFGGAQGSTKSNLTWAQEAQIFLHEQRRELIRFLNRAVEMSPQILAWRAEKARLREEAQRDSFCGRGLDIPGTIVETRLSGTYLLGSFPESLLDDDTVIRYRVLEGLEGIANKDVSLHSLFRGELLKAFADCNL